MLGYIWVRPRYTKREQPNLIRHARPSRADQ